MKFKYLKKTDEELKKLYYNKKSKKNNKKNFENFECFLKWYNNQEKECFYCGLKEEEMQKLTWSGILKSKRFPIKFDIKFDIKKGKNRGVWLEIDRKNPEDGYYPENCVLCCYFCNNDKSDIFIGDEYKKFYQNRVNYLRELFKKGNNLVYIDF